MSGRMNKVIDKRLIKDGEYIDALNIRMGSTENDEVGVVTNTMGNIKLTQISFDGAALSEDAKCIGALDDGSFETIYWAINDPSFATSPTGKLDMVVSFNVLTSVTTYHLVSMWDGVGVAADGNTTLNFDQSFLITGFNKVEDLIFFTDNLNQPRELNARRSYPVPIAGLDGFLEQDILVIKRPPLAAPSILPLAVGDQSEFLEERFICFAYRYRYKDDEYSATSQWTAPSFLPNGFTFSISSQLNEGMVNSTNSVQVTFNSGPASVIGIDLLFKEMSSSIIKVIEKLDKANLGYANDTEYNYNFTNSKIFTILPEAEILRLYDSVPLQSKAQTIIGNRLMYGNYVEGGDLSDLNGYPTKFEFIANLITEEIGVTDLPDDTTDSGDYTISVPITVADSIVEFNLLPVANRLIVGSSITLRMVLRHSEFTYNGWEEPDTTTANIEVVLVFVLQSAYASVHEMATSQEFIDRVGSLTNIQTVEDSCDGITLTDVFNCKIPSSLGSVPDVYYKYKSGIDGNDEPIRIISSDLDSMLKFQLPAMAFVDDIITPTKTIYEYYKISSASAFYQEIASPTSLHSNRGYEVGISYMDEFKRASPALVSQDNTVHVPCEYSDNKNSIQISIPTSQIAPSWATSYKFLIKPDREGYETIYSNIYFTDSGTNLTYFMLDGENSSKVEKDDRLIVKRDTSGSKQSCVYATVLDKSSLLAGSIGGGNPTIKGVYMKVNAFSFNTVQENNDINGGYRSAISTTSGYEAQLNYLLNIADPDNPGMYIDTPIPAGTELHFDVRMIRKGPNGGNHSCNKIEYKYAKRFVCSQDYENIEDWFYGDNFGLTVNDGTWSVGNNEAVPVNEWNSDMAVSATPVTAGGLYTWRLWRKTTNNAFYLMIEGGSACGSSDNRQAKVEATINIYMAGSVCVFETQPLDSAPDIWYESDQNFEINSLGEHMGNVQNQNIFANTPAIIDTSFFNCWSFGNGVESYKIRDSIIGKPITLGNRVTSTQDREYQRTRRFADISYSGIYNEESNVNKLNEFNAGLINYKNLEISFGPVQRMDSRGDDLFVGQEDKLSYVLTGKDLLSDLGAGNLLTAVPDVLGKQMPRIENYGMSNNPESYVSWGMDRFMTDAKRGAVLQLKGTGQSGQSDQLAIVSNLGMRTWFRDLFNESFTTQKLGGFDPYMGEYVLSTNNILLPSDDECVKCGIIATFTITPSNPISFCSNLGELVGEVQLRWRIISTDGDITITSTYNGVDVNAGPTPFSGFLLFDKDSVAISDCETVITGTGTTVVQVVVGCPQAQIITIVEICVSSLEDEGRFIHNEYRWQDGQFLSPLHSSIVEMQGGESLSIVSLYNQITGPQGAGVIPSNSANVRMFYNRFGFDDFTFNETANRFMYYRSNDLYGPTDVDIVTLLGLATEAAPLVSTAAPLLYYADFPMPMTEEEYLYLIWDYRKPVLAPAFNMSIETQEDGALFTLPLKNTDQLYDFVVEWGDGQSDSITAFGQAESTHEYVNFGTYIIRITGTFRGIAFANSSSASMAKNLKNWGVLEAGVSLANAFAGCENLVITALDGFDTTGVTNMTSMFSGCSVLNNVDGIEDWDTSVVTLFGFTFSGCRLFNQDIGGWDTSSAVRMSHMFYRCDIFNQSLNDWDIPNVVYVDQMFRYCLALNQPFDNWNAYSNNFNGLQHTFSGCESFNQDLSGWLNGPNSCTSMYFTFYNCSVFTSALNDWDTSGVTDMSGTFYLALVFNSPLENWDVSNVTSMGQMFFNAQLFNQPIALWDTSLVQNMSQMFRQASAFNQELNSVGLNNWVTIACTSTAYMFSLAVAFNQDISDWNTSLITDTSYMFDNATAFDYELPTVGSSWDVSAVVYMIRMFGGTSWNHPLTDWVTTSLRYTNQMFIQNSVFNQSVNHLIFDSAAGIVEIVQMFYLATSFNNGDAGNTATAPITSWDLSSVQNMSELFLGCSKFNQDLSSLDVSSVQNMYGVFANCVLYKNGGASLSPWTITNVLDFTNFLSGCVLDTVDYDAMLVSFAGQSVQPSVTFNGGLSEYTDSPAAAGVARASLIADDLWNITDGGPV